MTGQLSSVHGVASWLRYLIAFVVFFHGWVYIPFGLTMINKLKGWNGHSLLFNWLIPDDKAKLIVQITHVTAGVVIVVCAAAIAFAPSVPNLWRPLTIIGAVLGLAAFAVFWDGQFPLFVEEGGIGIIICLIMIAGALAFPNAFR